MRVLVFGQERFVHRMSSVLAEQRVDVMEVTPTSDINGLLKAGGIIMALVEQQTAGAEDVCRKINESGDIALVLVVERGRLRDWGQLDALKPSGIVSESDGDSELSARLNAITRRIVPAVAESRQPPGAIAEENYRLSGKTL